MQEASPAPTTPAHTLLPLIVPALVVGVLASLLFIAVSEVAEQLQHVLWENLPDALGIGRYSVFWMLVMLTATGIAVGLVVWKVPGHAGPDPATTSLEAVALPLMVLPGLVLATVLMLAGGPSLGPENPIIAVNVGLALWVGRRLAPRVPGGGGRRWPSRRRSARCSGRRWRLPWSCRRRWPGASPGAPCGTTCSRRSPRPRRAP